MPQDLETLISDAKEAQASFLPEEEISVPKSPAFFTKVKEYWEQMKPKTAGERAYYLSSPAGYMLWRMPNDLHDKVNKVLSYSSLALSRLHPVAGLTSGIAYGLSELVYGIKNKSGKKLISGLIGSLTHLRKIGDPKITAFADRTLRSLDSHFSQKA